MTTFLFTGGGTAGHVIPAKPVMRHLLERGDDIVYVGSKSGLESDLVSDLGVRYFGITTGKLRRYLSFQNLFDAFRVPVGILQALWIVARAKPSVVFSKGGFVAFPVVVASWVLRVPVVAHESDLTPGLATRLCTPFVKLQCVNFETTRTRAKKVVVSGTPIRTELLNGNASNARKWLKLTEGKPVIVVVGGSLGAGEINRVVHNCAETLANNYIVLHVCGREQIHDGLTHLKDYYQFEFIDKEWGDVLALADVVVSRSGANALLELLTLRKPNILIPLPITSSRGDQIENAEYSEVNGWSLVIPQEKLTENSLLATLDLIVPDTESWIQKIAEFPVRDSLATIVEELDRFVD